MYIRYKIKWFRKQNPFFPLLSTNLAIEVAIICCDPTQGQYSTYYSFLISTTLRAVEAAFSMIWDDLREAGNINTPSFQAFDRIICIIMNILL